MGVCTAYYDGKKLSVTNMGCIETKKSQRKVLACDDNVKRLDKVYDALWGWGCAGDIMCAESMSFPRNSGAAAKVAMTWGLIVALKSQFNMALVQSSPQDIKLAVADTRTASKATMQVKLMSMYPEVKGLLEGIPASRQEHPIDALGAIVAALDSDIVKAGLK